MPSVEHAQPDASLDALRTAYLEALLAPDVRRARELVSVAVDAGADPRAIYLDVLAPALHEVGRLWASARIGVGEEHLATAVTQSVMSRLGPRMRNSARPARGRSVIVACAGSEMHALGAQMVADFLEADGWDVLPLGAFAPPAEIVALARARQPAAVALSATMPARLPVVRETCVRLRELEPRPLTIVGGQGVLGSRELAQAVCADAVASDAAEAVRVLAEHWPG